MVIKTNKDKGRTGLSLAIGYFGSNGYTISLPLNDTQWYDLIIEENGVFQTVQCKFTDSKDREICIQSKGGTSGDVYDSMLDHPLDLIFCADGDGNMFVIPMDELRKSGNIKSFSLRTTKNPYANSSSFDSSQFLVQF